MLEGRDKKVFGIGSLNCATTSSTQLEAAHTMRAMLHNSRNKQTNKQTNNAEEVLRKRGKAISGHHFPLDI